MYIRSLLALASGITLAVSGFTTQEAAPVEIVGTKFFNSSSGEQFFIKGVAYQRMRKEGEVYNGEAEPGYIDSLASPNKCLRDLEYLKELGVNTVRVYQIDPTQSHDVCMDAFANHGIYVLADMSEPGRSINRIAPSWDASLLSRYKAVVDNMHKYTNLLGFIAGNEVVNSVSTSNAGAFVKASVRDIKQHIRSKNYRDIPVGYASTDELLTRVPSAQYMTCESNDTVVDFYGINMFEWCGFSSYETSGYRERTSEFSKLPVPVFFSEFGCNTDQPRPFTEIDLLFGPTMAKVWSGGLVYELFQHENNYGLIEEREHGKVVKLSDFNIVKLRLLEANPVGTRRSDLALLLPPSECPQVPNVWNLLRLLPPTPDDGKCECLQATLLCIITPYLQVDETKLIADVCSKTNCLSILADGSRGVYGSYSDCSPRQRASYALTKFWEDSQRKPESCDFDRRAILVQPEPGVLDSLNTADGRSCRAALGLEQNPEQNSEQGQEKQEQKQEHDQEQERIADASNQDATTEKPHRDANGKVAAKSAAQKPGQFGFLMFMITMVSFIYLAT